MKVLCNVGAPYGLLSRILRFSRVAFFCIFTPFTPRKGFIPHRRLSAFIKFTNKIICRRKRPDVIKQSVRTGGNKISARVGRTCSFSVRTLADVCFFLVFLGKKEKKEEIIIESRKYRRYYREWMTNQ